jgi:hypothetical protein
MVERGQKDRMRKEPRIRYSLQDGCWWLMPVILATWEDEIVRIMVPGQHR